MQRKVLIFKKLNWFKSTNNNADCHIAKKIIKMKFKILEIKIKINKKILKINFQSYEESFKSQKFQEILKK